MLSVSYYYKYYYYYYLFCAQLEQPVSTRCLHGHCARLSELVCLFVFKQTLLRVDKKWMTKRLIRA